MSKVALITGITGQDGSYLASFLLRKGYTVWGMKRRSSSFNTARIDALFAKDRAEEVPHFYYFYGDLADAGNVIRHVQEVQPDEIYNLGAMSHVKISFDEPEYTGDVDGLGTLRLLEAIRICGLEQKTRFYQASTSELFGNATDVPQSETTAFRPRSPYAAAKLYAYWTVVNYREAYGLYACNGILFNHESPMRGETFVTRKITRAVANIALGFQDLLSLGNLDAQRDWGHARDYVEAMYLMLQQPTPDDYVIASGRTTSVREFARRAFEEVGIELAFEGRGVAEKGFIANIDRHRYEQLIGHAPWHLSPRQLVLQVDPFYFRPTEVDLLVGNPAKAKASLGWQARCTLEELVAEMVAHDVEIARRDEHLKNGGFEIIENLEEAIR